MTASKLKNKFLQFFQANKHEIISSASLMPDNDPTVLFTTAGMHPLVPYLLGEKHPAGARLANVQKCLRTGDIDEVGDASHHTFFEMLGNWSLGNSASPDGVGKAGYFKKEAIEFAWKFVTKELKLGPEKLAITIFAGNNNIKDYDQETEKCWLDLGISADRIAKLADNWWGPAGQTGPCGPDTEIFYWTGADKAPAIYDPKDDRWVEIWNLVIMEYNKIADHKYIPLQQKTIDTGLGLERTLAALNGYDDNYQTELFQPMIKKLEKIADTKYEYFKKEFRIIVDHLRAATFLLGDANHVSPSNKGQGYVLRRLIRRAIIYGKKLRIEQNFCTELAKVIIEDKYYSQSYPEIKENKNFIFNELNKEEAKFSKTSQDALNKLAKKQPLELHEYIDGKEPAPKVTEQELKLATLSGKEAFDLYQTNGLNIELIKEEAKKFGLIFGPEQIKEFEAEFKKHQDLSRTASAGMFKGGLADDSEMSRKYHTATHLLHQALRKILGEQVEQRGSNINAERMRFDFVHPQKMTAEEIQKVENLVNQQIKKGLNVNCQEMTMAEAKEYGAIGFFTEKYGEKIKIYTMGDFSKEICGGPHVANTSELGKFKIIKEEAVAASIRRIKAILISNE